jgi:3'-5' exoribonuclease
MPVRENCLRSLRPDEEASFFALLGEKTKKLTKTKKPYWVCAFRDKATSQSAKIWSDSALFAEAETWNEGDAFLMVATLKTSDMFGPELSIRSIRLANESDRATGFDPSMLLPDAIRPAAESWSALRAMIEKSVDDKVLRRLLDEILDAHAPQLQRLQAATGMHHAYVGGLIEHIWSLSRLATFVAEHYARYYSQLDPPINRSLIIAAIVLHDIGKLQELEYSPVQARYSKQGRLCGHIVLGRDLVRQAAGNIPDFPEEMLLMLEHAILAHHGTKAFGSPVEPQTIEALIVSKLDLMDAKVNSVAMELMKPPATPGDAWTDKIYACENNRFYRGMANPAADQNVDDNSATPGAQPQASP